MASIPTAALRRARTRWRYALPLDTALVTSRARARWGAKNAASPVMKMGQGLDRGTRARGRRRRLIGAVKKLDAMADRPAELSGAAVRSGAELPWFCPIDEIAGLHSITSSARARIDCGTLNPSALAVLRLTANSKCVGPSIGSSPGGVPCRMRAM